MKITFLITFLIIVLTSSCNSEKEKLVRLQKDALKAKQKTVDIRILGYCLDNLRERNQFYAINMSTKVEGGGAYIDFDRDGIPNYRDDNTNLNITFNDADSNDDGYSDLIVYFAGITTEQQEFISDDCDDHETDSDGDGLNDCEEDLIKSDKNDFDTDKDGIPDYLEVRNGMDPVHDPLDAELDTDGDGISNINEVKANTPINESNSNGIIQSMAIRYDTFQTETVPQVCYTYTIHNIPIVSSSNANLIRLFFIENLKANTAQRYLRVVNLSIERTVETDAKLTYNYSDF